MNLKTFIAGAAFVVLAVLAVKVLRSPEKGTRVGEAPRPIPALPEKSFDTLVMTRDDGSSVTLKRVGDAYRVTAPGDYGADKESAAQAFTAVSGLSFDVILTDQKAKHAELGVDDKALRLTVRQGERALAKLRLGREFRDRTAVRVEGKDQVWNMAGELRSDLDRSAEEWRDKSITSFEEKDLRRIEVVDDKDQRILVARTAVADAAPSEQRWSVVESTVGVEPFDHDVPTSIAMDMSNWKAASLANDVTLEDAGLSNPRNRVTVHLTGGRAMTVLMGKRTADDHFYVKRADRPQVFLVERHAGSRIDVRPRDFRNQLLCNLKVDSVREIRVDRKKDAFTLIRVDHGEGPRDVWKATRPADFELDDSKVLFMLAAFSNWKADGLADGVTPRAAGLTKPVATIVGGTNVPGEACILQVGKRTPEDKEKVYVGREGDPQIYLMGQWQIDRVVKPLDQLRKKSAS